MRQFIFALIATLIPLSGAFAATYYVRPGCSNNGDGSTSDCAGTGGGAGAFSAMSSVTGAVLARGNTVYLIGASTAAWNPGGVGAGDGVSNFVLRGDSTVEPGGFDGRGTLGTLSALSGASRNNIEFKNLFFKGSTSSCITTGTNTNLLFDGITIPDGGCATHGIAINGGGTTIEVKNSTFGYVGPDANNTGGAVYLQPATGTTVTGVLIHDNSFTGNNDFGRYGVAAYPPDTGTVSGLRIYNNTFRGSFSYMPITTQNDVDGTHIYNNDIQVTAAQGGIHVGGQPTIGACTIATDNTWIYNNVIKGTGPTTVGMNDDSGNGVYSDECSVGTLVFSNEISNNGLAGIYLNDSANGRFFGNVVWGNGSNAINVHGISDGNFFYQNSLSNQDATFGNGATQGRDAIQQDSTAGNTTANVYRNNTVVGNANVCFDVDGNAAFVSESFNNLYGCPTLAEGFSQTSGVSGDPLWAGGADPSMLEGFRPKAASPLCDAALKSPPIAGVYYDGQRFGQRPDVGALACQ